MARGAEDLPALTVNPLVVKPSRPDDPTPIACTLPAAAVPGRIEDWAGMLAFVTGRSSVEGGVRLELDPTVPVGELAHLARAEQDCCRFFSFALTVDTRGVGLEVRAPDDALPIVFALFGTPPSLALLIDHDDAEREFRYVSTVQTFTETEPITDVGARLGWTVVSMANDWEVVFPPLPDAT